MKKMWRKNCRHSHLTFDKGPKNWCQEKTDSHSIKKKLMIVKQKTESRPMYFIMIKMKSQWIKAIDINTETQSVDIWNRKTKKGIGIRNYFLYPTASRVNKWNYIKIKTAVHQRKQWVEWRNHLNNGKMLISTLSKEL